MANSLNQPLVGSIEPVARTWGKADAALRKAFYAHAGKLAIKEKRAELSRAIGSNGRTMRPRKRPRPDHADGPVLTPHAASSRTARLLAAKAWEDGLTLFWHSGINKTTRTPWGTILAYHAEGRVRGAPVRDVRLSTRGISKVKKELAGWWTAMLQARARERIAREREEAARKKPRLKAPVVKPVPKAVKPRPVEVIRPKPEPTAKPVARPNPVARLVRAIEPEPRPTPKAPTISPGVTPGSRAEAVGLRVIPGSPRPVTAEEFMAVLVEAEKLPAKVHEIIKAVGGHLDILAGRGITDHPLWARLRGVTPRGWPEGSTWDDIPGAGASKAGHPTVIVANSLHEGHGTLNLTIHEHAHTFDSAHSAYRFGGQDLSEREEWREIHASASWATSYYGGYPEEGFAHAFEQYFHGPASRAAMDPRVRAYVEKVTS